MTVLYTSPSTKESPNILWRCHPNDVTLGEDLGVAPVWDSHKYNTAHMNLSITMKPFGVSIRILVGIWSHMGY